MERLSNDQYLYRLDSRFHTAHVYIQETHCIKMDSRVMYATIETAAFTSELISLI